MSRLTRFAIITLALVLAAPGAHAGTTTTIGSGIDCAQAYTEEGGTSYAPDGGMYSTAASWWRTAVCPMRQTSPYIRDSTALVSVIDQSYNLDVTCRIVLTTSYGWTFWGMAATSIGSSPNRQTISLRMSGPHQDTGRHLALCYLPPVYSGNRSGLISYEATMTTWP